MSEEIEFAIADSLRRQIIEAKRQAEEIKNKSKSKFLEIRRKTDQRKARLVLTTLKLKKQLQDCQGLLEESRKQWSLELSNSQDLIQKYIKYLKKQQMFKTKQMQRIISHMSTVGKIQDLDCDETESNPHSSQEATIVQECTTDIMYLSANLKAVIEGSTLETLTSRESINLKLMYIIKDLQGFLKQTKNLSIDISSHHSEKSLEGPIEKVQEEAKVVEISESLIKNSHHKSTFSFSNPDMKSAILTPIKAQNPQDASLSSEWEMESEVENNNEKGKNEDSQKWNSISVISLHSASVSNTSEVSESVELLNAPVQKATQTEFKKKTCWKRYLCCMCKS